MTADSDYARVLALLSQQRLPAYVSYIDEITTSGRYDNNGDDGVHGPQRVTVDTRTKK